MSEQDTETRFIGGSRVLLVRKYTGGRRRRSPDTSPTRCLLEREVNLVDSLEQTESPQKQDDKKQDNKKPVESTRNYGLIGTGAVAATALIGAWFYVQNSE